MVRFSAKNLVGRDEVWAKVSQLITEAGLSAVDYKFAPKTPENRAFRLSFEGHTGPVKAKQLVDSLRSSEGTWKEVTVGRPSGGDEKLFIGLEPLKE